jgi:glycine/D-amino acid oxidase-like deaminating enzyme
MPAKPHAWGTPPWTVDFHPHLRAIPECADFVVVGAGFSGLSAAAWLKRLAPAKSVLVLERETLGDGASGRTGGMALAETAAGDLPGLGDVLRGYRRILRALKIDGEVALPGAWELGRHSGLRASPIRWKDSGELCVVREVRGGTVNPGKVVAGLARAAQSSGARIVEHAEVTALGPGRAVDMAEPEIKVLVRVRQPGKRVSKTIRATKVLLASNAQSLDLAGLAGIAEPKLTTAVATEPLKPSQIKVLGLRSRRPFYTVDFPYLWGRLMNNNAAVFGAGLADAPDGLDLGRLDVQKGVVRECLLRLESRVRELHPVLKDVRITHRWGGPILFTEGQKPVFRAHPTLAGVMVLAGYNGHGVALSVYLGEWAAQALLGRRELPKW